MCQFIRSHLCNHGNTNKNNAHYYRCDDSIGESEQNVLCLLRKHDANIQKDSDN